MKRLSIILFASAAILLITLSSFFWPSSGESTAPPSAVAAEQEKTPKLPFELPKKKELIDTDGDGLDDRWERRYFGDLHQSGEGDPDRDGLTNAQEHQRGPAFRPNRKTRIVPPETHQLHVHLPAGAVVVSSELAASEPAAADAVNK